MESIDESSDALFCSKLFRKVSSESQCSSKRSSDISLISQGSLHRLITEANDDTETDDQLLEEIKVISLHQEITLH